MCLYELEEEDSISCWLCRHSLVLNSFNPFPITSSSSWVEDPHPLWNINLERFANIFLLLFFSALHTLRSDVWNFNPISPTITVRGEGANLVCTSDNDELRKLWEIFTKFLMLIPKKRRNGNRIVFRQFLWDSHVALTSCCCCCCVWECD